MLLLLLEMIREVDPRLGEGNGPRVAQYRATVRRHQQRYHDVEQDRVQRRPQTNYIK
jgi:hypothetical protein